MAITQSTSGVLTCNSVTRSWYVLPNLIAYGCGDGSILDGDSSLPMWTTTSITRRSYTWNSKNIWDYTGSRYAYKFTASASVMRQALPVMTSGTKYYFSCWYSWAAKPTGSYASSVTAYITNTNVANGQQIFTTSISNSSSDDMINTAHFYSTVFTLSSYRATPEIRITANSRYTASTGFWITRMILIKIPSTSWFNSASNDTICDWCDDHIREHRTYIGNGLNTTSYLPIFKTYGNWNTVVKWNYGEHEDINEDPGYFRECYWQNTTKSASEAYMYSDSTLTLTQAKYYYSQLYVCPLTDGTSKTCDWYFPIAEPALATSIPLVTKSGPQYETNEEWQIASGYGLRNSWATASSQQCRFDLNNTTTGGTFQCAYWGLMISVDGVLTKYNTDHSASLTTSSIGVNKSFFDCWVDGCSQPIIHLHDPDANQVIYKTNYDIVCNDVIVDPTINKIYFDDNAIIHCKSLVTNAPLI